MKNYMLICTAVLSLTGCGEDWYSRNQEKVNEDNVDISENNNTEINNNNNEICPRGESKREHDNRCWHACRQDADGKFWCLKADEFPSDTDPEKKVLKCTKGLLHNDQCVSPVRYVRTREAIELYAGEHVKYRDHKDITNERISPKFTNGIDKHDYRGLMYTFPTKYPSSVLEPIQSGGSSFGTITGNRDLLTNGLVDIKKWEKSIPEAIQYEIFGTKFDSFVSFDEFERVCSSILSSVGWGRFNKAKINENSSTCDSILRIYQTCDQEHKQCTITEIMDAW